MSTGVERDAQVAANGPLNGQQMSCYAGVPGEVVTECEQLHTMSKAVRLEALRRIQQLLAPYGQFKQWCHDHEENYGSVQYQLSQAYGNVSERTIKGTLSGGSLLGEPQTPEQAIIQAQADRIRLLEARLAQYGEPGDGMSGGRLLAQAMGFAFDDADAGPEFWEQSAAEWARAQLEWGCWQEWSRRRRGDAEYYASWERTLAVWERSYSTNPDYHMTAAEAHECIARFRRMRDVCLAEVRQAGLEPGDHTPPESSLTASLTPERIRRLVAVTVAYAFYPEEIGQAQQELCRVVYDR